MTDLPAYDLPGVPDAAPPSAVDVFNSGGPFQGSPGSQDAIASVFDATGRKLHSDVLGTLLFCTQGVIFLPGKDDWEQFLSFSKSAGKLWVALIAPGMEDLTHLADGKKPRAFEEVFAKALKKPGSFVMTFSSIVRWGTVERRFPRKRIHDRVDVETANGRVGYEFSRPFPDFPLAIPAAQFLARFARAGDELHAEVLPGIVDDIVLRYGKRLGDPSDFEADLLAERQAQLDTWREPRGLGGPLTRHGYTEAETARMLQGMKGDLATYLAIPGMPEALKGMFGETEELARFFVV